MSTVQRVNLTPVSDILPLNRRDFSLGDPTLADPTNATCLVDGEWFTINSSYQSVRPQPIGVANVAATVRSFLCWAERGRYDVQAMSRRAIPLIWLGESEWDTRIFDASQAIGAGATITTVLQPLKVAIITIGTRNFSGLVGHGGSADSNPVVGYVTKLPANNGGQLRFRSGYRQ